MKRALLISLALAVAAGAFVALWGRVEAQDKPSEDPVKRLQDEVKALQADLAKLEKEHRALKEDVDKLKTSFQRHSHPVKFWDPEKKQATGWKELGSFFLAYPKVGEGDTDAAAVKAGGLWGNP